MYNKRPSFVIGFHGCDVSIRDKIVMGQLEMKRSENDYDWLGNGGYFWENNEERAYQFACEQVARSKVDEPAVLGAFIDLGNCLDLLDSKYLNLLKRLDCAVIESLHVFYEEKGIQPFDSVRGVFWEGDDLYPGSGMKEKNHIQICIRNFDCIKGFFIPRLKLKQC